MNYIKMKDDNGEYTIEVESLSDLDVCVEVMERLLIHTQYISVAWNLPP